MHTEKIVSIQRIQPEQVYNISVVADESYTANGVVVHNCRSRLVPYFGKIPGDRDFEGEYGSEFVENATGAAKTFRKKYWSGISAAGDSVGHVALKRELATFRSLLVDRCPASKVNPPRTVDDAYANI